MRAYNEGFRAAIDGVDLTANPYAVPDGGPLKFQAWFAGWCHGKRVTQGIA